MIEFRGELTGECKRFLLRRQIRNQSIVSAIVFVLFSIPMVVLAVSDDPIWLLGFIPLIMLMILSVITPSKKDQKKFMPICVCIDLEEETIVVHHSETSERFRMISAVKCVEDYGEWYYFVFNYENRAPYFVCQKSLLQKGTLEQFEEIFQYKITRINSK